MSVAVDRRRSSAQRDPYSLTPPSWVWERLTSCPKAGQGVNAWLFSTARALAPFFSEAELVELLRRYSAGCGRVVTEREIVGQVRRGILASGRRLPGGAKSPPHNHVSRIGFNPAALEALAANGPQLKSQMRWWHWLWERSPVRPEGGLGFLNHLYRAGETVHLFTRMDAKTPALSVRIGGEMSELPPEITDSPLGLGTWFLANPVDGKWHATEDGGSSCRSKEAVTDYRYAVIESDKADALHWLGMLATWRAPVAAIYTSGGRSIHALLRVDAESKAEWDACMTPFKPQLAVLGADTNALTAVRLSRLPGCTRREKDGFQEIYYLDPNPDPETSIADFAPQTQ